MGRWCNGSIVDSNPSDVSSILTRPVENKANMAENEVLKALNVLKRYGKINSILFWELEETANQHAASIFFPDIYMMWFNSKEERLNYKCLGVEETSSFIMQKDEALSCIEQWRLAKLAVAFL